MSGILQSVTGVTIRDPLASDQRFIAATMYHSVLGRNRAPSRRRRINEQIDRILDDKSTRALVACSLGDSDRILGWILYSSAPVVRCLHYLYVRDDERGKGIARRLVLAAWPESQARFVVTMKGPDTRAFMERKNVSFIPVEEVLNG